MRCQACSSVKLGLWLQGLTLAIPELVPFRLTQNLVDAFGVSGCEGAYRRACEVTLQVAYCLKTILLPALQPASCAQHSASEPSCADQTFFTGSTDECVMESLCLSWTCSLAHFAGMLPFDRLVNPVLCWQT